MQKPSPARIGQFSRQAECMGWRLAALAGANAGSVTSLYLGQVLATTIAFDLPGDAGSLALIPGATLVGYAIGISVIAFGPWNRVGLPITTHIGLMAVALCAAGLSPNATIFVLASVAIGAGASVAQRLLAAAGRLGGAMQGGTYIGKTICTALTAVLVIRLVGDVSAQLVGWRTIFFVAAAIVSVFGKLNDWLQPEVAPSRSAPPTSPGRVAPIWRRSELLRWAMFQHGALFAAYNIAWMTILVELPFQDRVAVIIVGGGTGVIAALFAGYSTDRFAQRDLARCGAAAVASATTMLLPFAYVLPPSSCRVLLLLLGMALLDGGLQVSLVANQVRVQAIMPNARPRLAALLTVCGSLGGAVGVGIGYWLWQRFGWRAPIGLAAVSGLSGLCCAILARSTRLNDRIPRLQQDRHTHTASKSRSAVLQEPTDGSLNAPAEI